MLASSPDAQKIVQFSGNDAICTCNIRGLTSPPNTAKISLWQNYGSGIKLRSFNLISVHQKCKVNPLQNYPVYGDPVGT